MNTISEQTSAAIGKPNPQEPLKKLYKLIIHRDTETHVLMDKLDADKLTTEQFEQLVEQRYFKFFKGREKELTQRRIAKQLTKFEV